MNTIQLLKKISPNFITVAESGLVYGPQGRLFRRNFEELWFLHCVTMSPYNIFLSEKPQSDFNLIARTSPCSLPFGSAVISNSKNSWNQNILSPVKLNSHQTAQVSIFNFNNFGKDLYHKLQKERKIWWRKLAQNPSRFRITEVKKIRSFDSVDIEAHFSFGSILLERITFCKASQVNSKKGLTDSQIVEHTVSFDWGCLALFCDACDSKSTQIEIHSKLAPHKIALCVRQCQESRVQDEDLNRFLLYLNNILRSTGLNTILTNSEEIVEACLVPFMVLIDKSSLENGIIRVRNRSTTLDEAVHISNLVKYVITRC
ncbi:DNA polymerase subunit gamma-2, mitochondrial [Calliopsis andreniformis]|uniref:DNA polymerase subunit gamma-2, mitochondrial n=1 Tax=Calliopsis andreniformis TaxID=337506 RepID=UPI003FCD108F